MIYRVGGRSVWKLCATLRVNRFTFEEGTVNAPNGLEKRPRTLDLRSECGAEAHKSAYRLPEKLSRERAPTSRLHCSNSRWRRPPSLYIDFVWMTRWHRQAGSRPLTNIHSICRSHSAVKKLCKFLISSHSFSAQATATEIMQTQ